MGSDDLDLTSLFKAVGQLEKGYATPPANDLARDGCIQRFEYTFELCWKMMKRHFALNDPNAADRMTKRDLFREAAKAELIEDPERWFDYLNGRNNTSHVYDQSKAEEVYALGKSFVADARHLLNQLLDRHA